MSKSFHLSLTFKIICFVVFYLMGISVMWQISRDDLHTAGEKLKFMEIVYQLDSVILEVRRYEKNFLLYNTPESFKESMQYLIKAEETVGIIFTQLKNLKATPLLEDLEQSILEYRRTFSQLASVRSIDSKKYEQMISITRDLGKKMNSQSAQLLEFEQEQLHSIFRELENRMNLWSAVAINLGLLMPFLTFFNIFKPLRAIKRAAVAIAGGRFQGVEVLNTRDEMQQVMEAFNTMVHELARRQDQVIQSKKLASLGTLTAGVAHQLNNPLNNISTSCQIALDELDSGERELLVKMLNNIDQETLRARDVVQGLLEFSRSKEFQLRTTQLAGVIHRAVRLVKSQIPADISVSVNIPDDLAVPIDVQRMQEVFINLIINAAQAIEQKGSISISAQILEQEGAVLIEIHDSGPGIPAEMQEQLFDPFYTTKEEGKGTGLGLSVVYGIIKKHNGVITVKSALGEGTSFFIRLPLHLSEMRQS